MLELSTDQQNALDAIDKWLDTDDQELTLGGYAGTGKTTLIKQVRVNHFNLNTAVCALAGKAVHVLQRKGIHLASTIHSTIYNTRVDAEGNYHFDLKDPDDESYDLIIVDEASMVSTKLYTDLLKFAPKILWVGDHGQLEPIGDNPNLMAHPQIRLERIHRQAKNSPIIQFAYVLRTDLHHGHIPGPNLKLIPFDDAGDIIAAAISPPGEPHTQIICAFNKTRHFINETFRTHRYKDLSPQIIEVGDRLICLRNDRDLGIFNGMLAEVTKINNITPSSIDLTLSIDDGERTINHIKIIAAQLGADKINERPPPKHTYWDYAYAITCHKAQGSEWDNCIVYEELAPALWSPERWCYTAATRASKTLTYISDRFA